MIIWNSLKLFPHIHGYIFIFANTEIYVIYVFVMKGFTVYINMLPIVRQTAGSIGLTFFVDSHGWPRSEKTRIKPEQELE